MSNANPLSLKVLEAYTRDVGRGVARIDYDSMDSLSASTGDVIEIRGKRRTVAKCLPLYPSDEGKGIIRVDGLVRNNAGVAIGDTVVVRKIKAVPAEKVIGVTPAADAVLVTKKTMFNIAERGTSLDRSTRVAYEDIGGLKEEIQKVREMIELPLRHPEIFEKLGIEAPKGVLLYGPP